MESAESERRVTGKQATTESCLGRSLRFARFAAAVILHGVGTGLIGIFIALLIRHVQEFCYGDDHGGFLEIAVQARPWRRICAVFLGGIFGAVSWYWLRGCDTQIVSVEESLAGSWMPPHVTILNAMIQDIVVASGGSFGREAAPREIAAMWGGALSWLFNVSDQERKVLVACGTGAGLAAVYSVPISGCLYTVEHVLKWDLSARSVIPAIVTSYVATVVAGLVVEDTGLYAMPKYSYEWPSMHMIIWAIVIGPASAGAAVLFRRLVKAVEQLKPQNRISTPFDEVSFGDRVRLLRQEEDVEVRKQATIIMASHSEIVVRFDGEASDSIYNPASWMMAEPEGPRDWKILVAMPTVSLVLGILAHDYPTLLGNGRALAEVAIERRQNPAFLGMLVFLKAGMTAAAIGSGAAGGILTPSVALGATLGAVVGEAFQALVPDTAPHHDQSMSVVCAAAFLSITMNSPVTALWLLVEFSAQGVRREDMLLLLQGDTSGIVKSKLALGMLVPTTIAVVGAQLGLKYGAVLFDLLFPKKPPASKRPTTKMRNSSYSLDFKSSDDDNQDRDGVVLDEVSKVACFACFRAGLLLNTFLTVGVSAAVPACHGEDTRVSIHGVLMAAVVGLSLWSWMVCRRDAAGHKDGFTQLAPITEEFEDEATPLNPFSDWECHHDGSLPVQEFEGTEPSETPGAVGVCSARHKNSWKNLALGAGSAVLCSAVGAVAPLAPWALHIWRDQGGGFTALVASASLAVAASACGASALLLRPRTSRLTAVILEALCTALLAVLATAAGFALGNSGTSRPVVLSLNC
eukprot:TRINITY_DN32119_c0_g1_i1.p1 TRINITY_DN32119_c0_g1~~TRINITY_DN32119_c0_g1_i1.p1  ORF type:complete len:804 (-),score=114.66 TRINITY_DN32119_c0_g1_i1:248-2659(-)